MLSSFAEPRPSCLFDAELFPNHHPIFPIRGIWRYTKYNTFFTLGEIGPLAVASAQTLPLFWDEKNHDRSSKSCCIDPLLSLANHGGTVMM